MQYKYNTSNNTNGNSPKEEAKDVSARGVPIKQKSMLLTSNKRNTRTVKRAKRRQRRNNSKNKGGSIGNVYIPEINQKPIQTRCFRYELSNHSDTTIFFTSDDIIACLCFVTNTSTAFYPLIDSFKLRRVGITILPDDNVGHSIFGIRWQGQNAPDVLDTIITGNAIPNHKSFFPSEGSTAWFWHDQPSSNVNLFAFTIENHGSTIIMDLELEYILGDGTILGGTLSTAATFTGIASHYLPLSGADQFVPVLLSSVN